MIDLSWVAFISHAVQCGTYKPMVTGVTVNKITGDHSDYTHRGDRVIRVDVSTHHCSTETTCECLCHATALSLSSTFLQVTVRISERNAKNWLAYTNEIWKHNLADIKIVTSTRILYLF